MTARNASAASRACRSRSSCSRLVALLVALGRDVAVGPDEADRPAGRVREHPGPRQHVVDGAVREHDPVGEREMPPAVRPAAMAASTAARSSGWIDAPLGDMYVDVARRQADDLGAALVDVPVAGQEVPRPGAELRDVEGEREAQPPAPAARPRRHAGR